MQKLRAPLVGAQGYQGFPLSKPVVGPNIALNAAPAYRAYTYLVSAFPAHSTSCSPNLQRCAVECVLSSESEFVTCGRNTFLFRPYNYDPSRLTGRKTSSIYLYIILYVYLSSAARSSSQYYG